MAHLLESIDLSKLTTDGVEFSISSDFVKNKESSSEDEEDNSIYSNKECIGLFDEDIYEEGEPFDIIAKKMLDVTSDGKIKKRIIRQGEGIKPSDYDSVKIHYNGYLEHLDDPFDSTYVRKKPRYFVVNDGRVIPGLDLGVQTMKLNEKAQFLIHPDYAFGKNSIIGKVPKNSTVLFEVELLEIVPSGYATTYEKLPEEKKELFSEVYKYCTALCEQGKKLFSLSDYKKAIIEYNFAAEKLKKVTPLNQEERQKLREFQLRVYSNLLVCNLRTDKLEKGCASASKIYRITENGELMRIPTKVFYNHAKCLRLLGRLSEAKEVLQKAYKLEPNNPDIANEVIVLNEAISNDTKEQAYFGKMLLDSVTE